jgi:capsular exopolysaccharide synthesis family protein
LRLLQKEKVKRDQELSEKFAKLLAFTRDNGVTTLENQGNHIVLRRLATLSDALTQAQLATISAKAELKAAEKMSSEPEKLKYLAMSNTGNTAAAISNSEENVIRANIRELQQKLEEARRLCTNDHPLVTELVAQIEQLESQLNLGAEEFADAYIEVLRQKYETSVQREEELYASFDAQEQEAQSLGLKATEYSVLQSELERTEKTCEIMDERIKELNVTEEAGALNINILEVAEVEDIPSKPEKAKVMAIVLMLGLILGSGTAVLRDWFDYRLRSVEEISATLGVPVLGVVPKIAAAAEETFVARGKHFWDIFREQISAVKGRLAVQVSGSGTAGSRTSDSGMITQLVMDCGRKVADRLRPIVTNACKGLGINLSSGQPDVNAKNAPAAKITNTETKDKGQKGWLKSQATTAEVYQQRLDRALFGSARKPASTEKQAVPVATLPQSENATASDRGKEILHHSRSSVAEAYRTIRTAVFFGVPKDEAKTIMVTSPAPGDGKSTLVSNLSIAMAQAGQRTLVIDCDFRKPTQQTIFNSSNKLGIANIFAENLSIDKAVQRGPVAGLDVLTRGPEVPNPCELLNSNTFAELLEKLSERYDRIIIDSAPITAVADSQILSAVSDVTILVLRAEKSTRRMSQLAMHLLQSVNARVLGVVVNGVSTGGGHYGYYYGGYGYYGKYGRYGYGEERRAENHQHQADADMTQVENRYNSEVRV